MDDFNKKLMEYPKRHEEKFTKEQLKHHLEECMELLENGDEHLYEELIDLIQITKVYLQQNLEGNEIDELYKKRFDKFISKLNLDAKK